MFPSLCVLWLAPTLATAALFSSPDQLSNKEYDFVVVGGGTAGSVIANRLSEDSNIRVLVIESGGNPDDVPQTIVPFQAGALRNSSMDWNFTTIAQPALNNSRSVYYARGHGLGGSTSTNIMAYNRGGDAYYNKWAELTGDSGWNWDSLSKYHLKSVHIADPADGEDKTGQYDPSAYGDGPVGVSVQGFKTPIDDTIVGAAKEDNGRFAFREDFGTGNATGVGYVPVTIADSKRMSAYVAYIKPVVNERRNLDVLIHTRATKLVQSGTVDGTPEFKVVEVAQSKDSEKFQFKATKEIILSGGVIGSVQILLHSGIGPKDVLSEVGLSPIVELPDVGTHLIDHPMVPTYYEISNNISTFDSIMTTPAEAAKAMAEYRESGTGRLAVPPANTFGFFRLPENNTILNKVEDPSSGPGTAHTELMFLNGFVPLSTIPHPPAGQNYFTIVNVVVASAGRGVVKITANDPWAKPHIDPKLMENEFDRYAIVQAVKDGRNFISRDDFKQWNLTQWGPYAKAQTDEEIYEYVKNYLVTINHPVSTNRMTAKGSSEGVVDPDLLVKKTKGLRIVDASVFPTVPECHAQGPVYILAERAADLIKSAHSLAVTTPGESDNRDNAATGSPAASAGLFLSLAIAAAAGFVMW